MTAAPTVPRQPGTVDRPDPPDQPDQPDPTGGPAPRRRLATALALVPDGVVSHAAAAWLLGLPGAPPWSTVCLTRPPGPGTRRRLEPGRLHLHTAPPGPDATEVAGFPVTSPTRSVCDVAREREPTDALGLADACLRAGLVTPAGLAAELAAHRGRPGVLQATRVLGLADPCAADPAESAVRAVAVLHGGLPRPLVGPRVTGGSGATHRVAMAWARARVAVLTPPPDPDDGPDAVSRDLVDAGWSVVVLPARALADPGELLRRLAAAGLQPAATP